MHHLTWPLIIVVWGMTVGLITAANWDSPLRAVLVFGFMLICPGMAFVRLLHIHGALNQTVIAIALSVAIDTLVAEIMVMSRQWSWAVGLSAIVAVSVIGAALQAFSSARPKEQE